MDVHPKTVMLLQSRIFLLQPPKPPPAVPPATASRGRLCCRAGFTGPPYAQTSSRPFLYSPTPLVILQRRQPHTAAEPVNPRTPLCVGIYLPRLPWLNVVPFLGLAVLHCPSSLITVWSTWSTNDIHRKRTVRGEADSWLHDYTQGTATLLHAT